MVFKNFVCAVGIILLAAGLSCAPQSASAQTWTVTTTGQISTGYDTSGIFGTANADLAGMTYTQTITASIDPAQWSATAAGADYIDLYGSGPLFTDTVTVGGHSVTYTAITLNGQQDLVDGVSTNGPRSGYDSVSSWQEGKTTSGNICSLLSL
jgi:hypothetical protein